MSSIPEKIAREFHTAYERLAPEHGYRTREASAVPWEQVPQQNKDLMVAVVADLIDRQVIQPATLRQFSTLEEMGRAVRPHDG